MVEQLIQVTMKNLRIIYLITAILAFTFSGCEKKYEELYRITYYPNFEMTGSDVIFNTFGTNFTDPGIKASEAGKEIPVTTTVSGDFFGSTSFNANSADRYLFTYMATNSDGYVATTSRLVYNVNTGNLVNSIEGLYTSTVFRNKASGAQYTNMKYIMISKTAANTYVLSDAIGGYYDMGRAYGAAYRAPGMTVTSTDIPGNSFTFGTADVGSFGGVVTMKSMTVDPTAKTIVFECDWDAGYTFVVTLKQVQL
jgi:hypothetical protein